MDHGDGDHHDGHRNGDGDGDHHVLIGHTVSLCECRSYCFTYTYAMIMVIFLHATVEVE
jgi:hypothetical protein